MITFEEGSGFAAFALFNALKLHFTTDSYDFFKYHGKTNVSKDNFANRKDKYSFYKLSRKYRMDDLRNFYISNFLQKDVNWVGDISGIDGEETYKKWQKRNQSLTYLFEQNIIGLLQDTNTPDEILKVRDGQYPTLLNEVMQGTIAIETLVILNNIMNFLPMWDKRISDTIIWPTWKRKIEKYSPFLIYDEQKLKNILKESVHEQA
jgi:hypothetical protein